MLQSDPKMASKKIKIPEKTQPKVKKVDFKKKTQKTNKYLPATRIRVVISRCPLITNSLPKTNCASKEIERITRSKKAAIQNDQTVPMIEENCSSPKTIASSKFTGKSQPQPKPIFGLGDIVLVKWRQFPDWPAVITNVEEVQNVKSTSTYFNVEFFPKRDT